MIVAHKLLGQEKKKLKSHQIRKIVANWKSFFEVFAAPNGSFAVPLPLMEVCGTPHGYIWYTQTRRMNLRGVSIPLKN